MLILLLAGFVAIAQPGERRSEKALQGAWQSDDGTMVFTGNFYTFTAFNAEDATFEGTHGGSWAATNGELSFNYEFNTFDPDKCGNTGTEIFTVRGKKLRVGSRDFTRLDNGKPGALEGAWLITGRQRGDEMSSITPGDRKTMKILSGTRFQWIAYNTATKQFMGTGGGSYTTKNGKYTETIEFFSRDSSRVGMALGFNYELKDGQWHHSGKSSKGTPIYEIWSKRPLEAK